MPQWQGTLVEAYWSTWRGPRIFIHVWLGIAIVIVMPSLIGSMRELLHGESLAQGNVGLAFIVPLVFVSWGLLLPRIGAALSFFMKKHVVGLLERSW